MKKIGIVIFCIFLMGCTVEQKISPSKVEEGSIMERESLILSVNEKKVDVSWESNASVEALLKTVKSKGSMDVICENYGGFEQVGQLPFGSIARNDVQMTTKAGDIVLYSGNSLVIFYGSNSWTYTKLGHINGLSKDELKEMLGKRKVTVTLSIRK